MIFAGRSAIRNSGCNNISDNGSRVTDSMPYTLDVKNRSWSPRKVEQILYMTKTEVEGE